MIFRYKELDINVEISGEGDALLLLHGWGCDHTIFNSCRFYLAERYTIYAFDLPGFGASTEPDSVWGTQDYVDMLRAFIVESAIEHPTLAGHSFGGRVSILYASQYEVSKLLLIDSAGVVPHRSIKYYFKVYSFKTLRTLCQIFLPRAMAQRVIEKRRNGSASSDYSAASPKMRAILSKVVNEELRPVMPNISAHTLLFWGDRDTATPLSDAKAMEQLIPNVSLIVASGAGHYSFLESRGLFDAVVKKFLNIK